MDSTLNEKYEILEQIGKGTYANVYKVQRKQDGKFFVVKQIEQARMNISEIDILRRFFSNYILHAEEIFFDSDNINIILELADTTLQEFAQEDITMETALMIAYQLAYAIGCLHQEYYHCDIKPDNVLIQIDSGKTLLSDFSLAYSIDLPGNGNVCANELFRPPEYFKEGYSGVSALNDWWAYGCTIFYLVAGRQFVYKEDQMRKYIDNPREYLEKYIADSDINNFLLKILAPNQSDRYDNVEQILSDKIFDKISKPSTFCDVFQGQKKFNIGFPLEDTSIKESDIYVILVFLLEVCFKINSRAQTYIFAVDLFMRTLPINEIQQNQLQAWAICCLWIASELYDNNRFHFGVYKGVDLARFICNYSYSEQDLYNTRINILLLTDFVIAQHTLYNYASNLEQLKIIFQYILYIHPGDFLLEYSELLKVKREYNVYGYTQYYNKLKDDFLKNWQDDENDYTIRYLFPNLL